MVKGVIYFLIKTMCMFGLWYWRFKTLMLVVSLLNYTIVEVLCYCIPMQSKLAKRLNNSMERVWSHTICIWVLIWEKVMASLGHSMLHVMKRIQASCLSIGLRFSFFWFSLWFLGRFMLQSWEVRIPWLGLQRKKKNADMYAIILYGSNL